MRPRLYFAYGSNMDPRQMRHRCPEAARLGRVTLQGFRFIINSRGVATIECNKRSKVMGVLWELGPRCEATLDRFEGIVWGFYRKERVVVCDDGGREFSALTYIDPVRERGLAREGYMERVLLGAKRADIPLTNFRGYFNWARRHAA